MGRVLFLLAIIILAYLLLKSFRKQAPKQGKPEAAEEMVRCSMCGIHLPRSESILVGGNYFCSDVHRREYNQK